MRRLCGQAFAAALLFALACGEPSRDPVILLPDEPDMPPALVPVPAQAPAQPPSPAAPAQPPSPAAPTQPQPPAAPASLHVSGDGYEGHIRPAEGPEHWQPTGADIAALEQHLPAALAAAIDRGELPPIEVSGHARRYFGYLQGASRLIEIKLFCERARHLARGDVRIRGGGACVVTTAWDTGARRFLYWRTAAQR